MNDVFREYMDDFVVYFIDNILIFSKNLEDHERHVCLVLEKFQKVGLYAKLEKCEFHQFKVEFLGYVIFRNGICMDFHNVRSIIDWVILAFVWNFQRFLEFVNFY